MLVLTRRISEIIDIDLPDGTHIEIVVVDLRDNPDFGRSVKLGITAPDRALINRREITRKIEGNKVA